MRGIKPDPGAPADRGSLEKAAAEICAEVQGRCLLSEPLSRHTSFGVGGPAAIYVYPADKAALSKLLMLCHDRSLAVLIIGYGNNLLVSDDGFAGCVVDLSSALNGMAVEGNRLTAGAGVMLNDVIRCTADHGLTGMERLAGIPGGVGGGMSMNCGAFGAHISDHLAELEVMNPNGEFMTLAGSGIEFGYRSAPGLADKVVLQAVFQLDGDRMDNVNRLIDETVAERRRRNVMTLPSAGSTFKNPRGFSAARLLEQVGAKGMRMGGVEVSPLHANFIVNSGGGTAEDIVALISKLREKVYKRFNIDLKLELRAVGFDYEIDA